MGAGKEEKNKGHKRWSTPVIPIPERLKSRTSGTRTTGEAQAN